MRVNVCMISMLVLFVSNVWGMDGIGHLIEERWIGSATVSSTNLVVKLQVGSFFVSQGDTRVGRHASEYIENDEMLILTPDKETRFSGRHGRALWTPISLKNNLKGFRIITTFHWWPNPTTTNAIAYLALSDTPVEVGEEDVEMIMEAGEWVKYGKPQPETEKGETTSPVKKGGAATLPPSRDDGQGNAQSKPNLWLYVGVSLCALCAILYFLRRKLKTGN